MLDLTAPITRVRSIGTRSAARLLKLGIRTVRQLLWHLPARYEDYRQSVPIAQAEPGQKQSIQGEVASIASKHIWPKRMTITTATIRDASGAIRAVWFNQPYLEDSLPCGTTISLSGKVVLDKRGIYISNPVFEKISSSDVENTELRHTGRLVPIYPETEGVTSKYLRFLIQPLLELLDDATDPLPETIRAQNELPHIADALRSVHYPALVEDASAARNRLAFDDLLLLQLKVLRERRQMNMLKSLPVPMDTEYMRTLVADLPACAGRPFTLTKDQRVATLEVLRDMERAYPMNRLLEGDVGSGKTVVALLAALHNAHQGLQTAILAPTEVLAQQHYRTLQELVKKNSDVGTALLTSSVAIHNGIEMTKTELKRAINSEQVQIAIGTHALLCDDVKFKALALVIIDEQHRFGVEQRASLLRSSCVPHLLSMTATPIPRTLALTVFGDLDISIIKEKPEGRLPIKTSVVSTDKRAEVYDFIRAQVREGRQVFVICPRIETEDISSRTKIIFAEMKAVEDEYKKLSREIFPDLRIAMLHGRIKAVKKQEIMHEFKDGWHDILVSTSVIEVGVDVPNATIMLIEGADRFGLSQLHQFRGRVGRAEHQSYCFLFASDDSIANRRLNVMAKTDDGFALAEQDMKIRGPGEFFGTKQSGIPDVAMEALTNVELIKKARATARAIMKSDPNLKTYPLLRAQLASLQKLSHFE